jgi:SpoIIAA-like
VEIAMLELLPAPDHVVALHMSGTLTAEDFDRAVVEIESKLDRHERIGVFVDMTGFEDMTAEAAAKDLRYSFGKIGEWHRFPREAVVTDKQWIRTLIQAVDPLVPQVEARSFAPSERDAAVAWASDIR